MSRCQKSGQDLIKLWKGGSEQRNTEKLSEGKSKQQKLYEWEQNAEIHVKGAVQLEETQERSAMSRYRGANGIVRVLEGKKLPEEYRKPKWRLSK